MSIKKIKWSLSRHVPEHLDQRLLLLPGPGHVDARRVDGRVGQEAVGHPGDEGVRVPASRRHGALSPTLPSACVCLSVCLSVCLPVCLVCLSVCVCEYLCVCSPDSERDGLYWKITNCDHFCVYFTFILFNEKLFCIEWIWVGYCNRSGLFWYIYLMLYWYI